MKEGTLLVLLTLIGSCAGIFWTNSKANDYPRIGRRSFYTVNKASSYPRLGRENFGTYFPESNKNSLQGAEKRSLFTSSGGKSFPRIGRGLFTKGSGDASIPRVGRRGSEGNADAAETAFPPSSELLDQRQPDKTNLPSSFGLPAPILFFAWDVDGDGNLTREEFVNGYAGSRKHRRLL